MYRWINLGFDRFNRKSPISVLTPWMGNIGNCSEQMYFGLLKAKRERKKVLFLFLQHPLFWKFALPVANKELMRVESEYIAPNDSWYGRLAAWLMTIVYSAMRVTYAVWRSPKLRRMIRRIWPHIREVATSDKGYVLPMIGMSKLFLPDGVHHFSRDRVEKENWRDQFRDYQPPRLKKEKREYCDQLRVEMGIPLSDWFACLHVRESGYHGDTATVYRNASIQNHIKGIQAITAAGGWVVRIGDSTMTPLPPLNRVIDYPHTKYKSELMDIYLFSMCRLFIGPNSGPSEAATLFRRPKIIINATEWSLAFLMTHGDLGILKHYFSHSRGRFLSIQEMINEPIESQHYAGTSDDYVLVENTSDEIEDVILEYLTKPEGFQQSELQKAFDEGRREQVYQWLEHEDFLSDTSDASVAQMYRFAARSESAAGTVGQRYLEQNWLKDNMSHENVSMERN